MAKPTAPSNRPTLPFALVEWDDPHSPDATEVVSLSDVRGVHGTIPMLTAGWVMADDAVGITLAAEWCGSHDYRGVTHIGRSAIRTVTPIILRPRRGRGRVLPPIPLPPPEGRFDVRD